MSTDACLGLLLDGPMQSWGHGSRFERRTTALHPTRSGIIGLIAAATGISKHGLDEAQRLERLNELKLVTFAMPRRGRQMEPLFMQRLVDYHTVTGIRRASGKEDTDATVQTYRHYLMDARFGVLLTGPAALLKEVAAALLDPKWGIWFGRKCCLPATPLMVAPPGERAATWRALLGRAGYSGTESEEQFDRVIEVGAADSAADMIEDAPVAFGAPIGQRHAPRWILRVPQSTLSKSH